MIVAVMWTDEEIDQPICITFARLGYLSVKSEPFESL